jgi:hypothetical protein
MKIYQPLIPILQFANSVIKHWGALVTSGALIGCLNFWQSAGHYVNPNVYWVIAIAGLFVAFFRAWNDQRLEKDKLLAASAKTPEARSAEWKELADRFQKICTFGSADWQCNRLDNQTTYEAWRFSEATGSHCETLCKYAGKLLLRSPTISPQVSDLARRQSNQSWCWLFYLKENHRCTESAYPAIGEDGTIYSVGRISNVAGVSERICLECAAQEL